MAKLELSLPSYPARPPSPPRGTTVGFTSKKSHSSGEKTFNSRDGDDDDDDVPIQTSLPLSSHSLIRRN